MTQISITIDPSGNVRINDVAGLGSGCQAETQDIEAALGLADEKSREITDNYHQVVDNQIKLSQ